jgi:hypothetical protein
MSNDNKIESSSLKKKKKQKNNNNYKNNAEKVKDDVDEEPPLLLKDLASDGFASSSSTQNALPPPPDEENQNQQQQGGEKVFGTGAAAERPTLTQAPLIEVEAYLVEDEEIEESGADGGDGGDNDVVYDGVIETTELPWWKQMRIYVLLSIIFTLIISMAFLLAVFLNGPAPPVSSVELSTNESDSDQNEDGVPTSSVSFNFAVKSTAVAAAHNISDLIESFSYIFNYW